RRGIDAAPPDAIAVMQRANPRRRSPWLGEFCRLLAVEARVKIVVQSMPVRFGGERRIVDDPEQRALDAGLYEGAQQIHRVAAPATAGLVGDIGKGERWQARVACNRECLLHGLLERGQLRIKSRALFPAVL